MLIDTFFSKCHDLKSNNILNIFLILKRASSSSNSLKQDHVFRMPDPLASSSLSSTLLSKLNSNEDATDHKKTPFKTKLAEKKLQDILESNSKTIKSEAQEHHAKPATRRALALANADSQPKPVGAQQAEAVQASGKVKQMIEIVEARMKTTTVPATPSSSTKPATKALQYSQSKLKPLAGNAIGATALAIKPNKLRSSIDKRKQRISSSKGEAKRQSTKRVNAFLRDIASAATPSNQAIQSVAKCPSTVKVQLFPTIKSEPVDLSSQSELSHDTTSSSHDNQSNLMCSAIKRPLAAKDFIANSSTVQQQYRLAQSTMRNTPSVHKNSFVKFLERNTPCKMTKTVSFD
jgi:hypothetical protein